jgi:hypothetical protein
MVTPRNQEPEASPLAKRRRWVNVSKLTQVVTNPLQSEGEKVIPGGHVEGAQYSHFLQRANAFRETTDHLSARELYPMVQEETDVSLLRHLEAVERFARVPRESILKAFRARIRVIEKDDVKG